MLLKAEGQVSGAGILQSAGDEPVGKPGKRLQILAAAALVVTVRVMQPNLLILDPCKQVLQIFGNSVSIGLFVLHRFIHCLPALWIGCVHHTAQLFQVQPEGSVNVAGTPLLKLHPVVVICDRHFVLVRFVHDNCFHELSNSLVKMQGGRQNILPDHLVFCHVLLLLHEGVQSFHLSFVIGDKT